MAETKTLVAGSVNTVKNELAFTEIFISACGIIAILLSVTSSYSVALISALPGLAFSAILDLVCKKEKTKNIFSISISVFNLIMAIIFRKYIENGLSVSFNNVLDRIGSVVGRIMPLLETSEGKTIISQCLFFSFMGIAVCFAVQYAVKRKSMVFAVLIYVLTVILCIALSGHTMFAALSLASVFLVSVVIIGKNEDQDAVPVLITVFCLAVFVISALLGFSSYAENYKGGITESIRASVGYTYDKIVYGGNDFMTEGDFSKIKGFSPDDTPALEVMMTEPESLYLRGFVGGKYTGKGFKKTDNAVLYEYSDLFYYLHSKRFYGWNELALAYDSVEKIEKTNIVTVKVVNASTKYLYVPYEVAHINGELYYTDSVVDAYPVIRSSTGEDYYSMKCIPGQVKRYTGLIDSLRENSEEVSVAEFENIEERYRAFVYANYLDIPDETYIMLKRILGNYDKKTSAHYSYDAAKGDISSFLDENVTYNVETDYNNKYDFLDYFLNIKKEGYSVHYATTAVLMLRYYGIPARYVEGFIVTPEQANAAQSNSVIYLSQQNVHAWAEYYHDGLGWLPFEVTPPYTEIMENASPDDNSASPEEKEDEDLPDNDEEHEEVKPADSTGKDEDDDSPSEYRLILIIAIIIILLILLSFAAFVFYRMMLKRKINDMNLSGNKAYAIKAYKYVLELLEIKDISFVYHSVDDGSQLGRLIRIYEKAKFGNMDISDEERKEFELFISKTISEKKQNSSVSGRFKDRFIYCKY